MKKKCFLFFLIVPTFVSWSCGSKPKKQSINYHESFQNSDSNIVIAIVPYHRIDSSLINLISVELENFYGIKTTILPKANMPDSCKVPYKQRYNANKILEHLAIIKPKQTPYILAITTEGIATKKGKYKEWGILGLGTCPGPCCVVSTKNMGKNKDRLKDRLIKVCLHEMGHNFGLPHCNKNDQRCLMRDANGTVTTVDKEEKYLCQYCTAFLIKKGFMLKQKSLN